MTPHNPHNKNLKEKNSRHNSLCEIVLKDLISRGFTVYMYKEYKSYKPNSKCGEIDLYATKPGYEGYILDIEVKATYSYKNKKKSIDQLFRAEENFLPFKGKRVFKIFAYGCPKADSVAYKLIY